MSADRSYCDEVKDSLSTDLTLSVYPILRPLYSMFFIEIVGWSMTIPVMAFFILKDLGLGPFELGLQVSAFALAQVIGSAVLGRTSDALGRRPVACFCFFWAAVGMFATALIRNFTELLITRAIAGLSGGTWPICQAYVLDVVNVWERGTYIGLLAATFSLGMSVGPGTAAGLLMTGVITRRMIFMISGGVCLAGTIIGLCFLKESLPEERKRALCGSTQEEEKEAESDWAALNLGLSLIWIARMCCAFGEFFLYSMYAVLLNDLFGFEDKEMGIILMCIGVCGAILNTFVFPATTRCLGPAYTTMFGTTLVGLGLALLPTSKTLWIHCCFLFLFCLGSSHSSPGFPVVMASYCSRRHLGFANGWMNSFRGISAVLSPMAGGILYNSVGPVYTFLVAGAAAWVASSLLLLVKCCTNEWEEKVDETCGLAEGKGKGKGKGTPGPHQA